MNEQVVFEIMEKPKQVFKLHSQTFDAGGMRVHEKAIIERFQSITFNGSRDEIEKGLEPFAEFLEGRRQGEGEPVTASWLLSEFTVDEIGELARELGKLRLTKSPPKNRADRRKEQG